MFRETPAWRTSAVVELCESMRTTKDYSSLPILADSLEDGGYQEVEVLNQMRKYIRTIQAIRIVAMIYSDATAHAVKRIEEAAYSCDVDSYEDIMEAATSHIDSGDYLIEGGRWEGVHLPEDFWDNYDLVMTTKTDEDKRY